MGMDHQGSPAGCHGLKFHVLSSFRKGAKLLIIPPTSVVPYLAEDQQQNFRHLPTNNHGMEKNNISGSEHKTPFYHQSKVNQPSKKTELILLNAAVSPQPAVNPIYPVRLLSQSPISRRGVTRTRPSPHLLRTGSCLIAPIDTSNISAGPDHDGSDTQKHIFHSCFRQLEEESAAEDPARRTKGSPRRERDYPVQLGRVKQPHRRSIVNREGSADGKCQDAIKKARLERFVHRLASRTLGMR